MTHTDIKQIIIDRVERSGFGVRELAERTNTTHAQLSRYLNGKADITTATLGRLMDELNLEIKARPGRPGKRSR